MPGEELIGKQVRCFAGYDRDVTMDTGEVIGFYANPTYAIKTERGIVHWVASLTEEIVEEEPPSAKEVGRRMAEGLRQALFCLGGNVPLDEAPLIRKVINDALDDFEKLG